MSDDVSCPVCELKITNEPARIDLPGGEHYVLVHPPCEQIGLTPAQIDAILAAKA